MSNETRWTEGPWETDMREHDEPYQKISVRPLEFRSRVIAALWQDDAPLIDYNGEQRANARLIAAAPDLYEVLETAVRQGERILAGDGPEEGEDFDGWFLSAKAALAKARGEQS